MFKIGEFSKLTQVSVRMLRHYDETGLLKPAKTDPWTGYRMYSAEQIPVLNKIIYLRDSGFQVAEIAAALNSNNDLSIVEQLDRKYEEIQSDIQSARDRLRKIELARKELLSGRDEMHYNITIKAIPGYQVLSLRKVIPDYYAEGDLWKELSEFAQQQKIEITDEAFSIYYDEDYREENVDVELCAVVKRAGQDSGLFHFRQTEPVSMMACTMVYGPFSNIAAAYLSFARWLQNNSQYKMKSRNRQIVHRGPWNEEDPQNYLTEIQIPVEKIFP